MRRGTGDHQRAGGRVLKTVAVDQHGGLEAGTTVSPRDGLRQMFDLFAPPITVRTLGANEITALAFKRVGHSLLTAMNSARDRNRS